MIHKAVSDRVQLFDENGVPIWDISVTEARTLTVAANNVIRHYDIAATQEMIDWGALMTTAFAIYLPRVGATSDARIRKAQGARQQPAPPMVAAVGTGN